MTPLAKTPYNEKLIKALKTVNSCRWVGNTSFDSIEECLTSINLRGFNSGFYTPTPIRIKGLTGIFSVNENGGLNFEYRILLIDEKYLIETLTTTGYDDFERVFNSL